MVAVDETSESERNAKYRRAFLQWSLIVLLSFVIHEAFHLVAAFLVGFDLTGTYVRADFPFLSIIIPNAPTISDAQTDWFLMRLSGGLASGVYFIMTTTKRRYFLPMAIDQFIYAVFEAFNLYLVLEIWLSILFITMLLISFLWLHYSIEHNL